MRITIETKVMQLDRSVTSEEMFESLKGYIEEYDDDGWKAAEDSTTVDEYTEPVRPAIKSPAAYIDPIKLMKLAGLNMKLATLSCQMGDSTFWEIPSNRKEADTMIQEIVTFNNDMMEDIQSKKFNP